MCGGMGAAMQRVVVPSLMAAAVFGGVFFGGAGVVAASTAPTATPAHADVAGDVQACVLKKGLTVSSSDVANCQNAVIADLAKQAGSATSATSRGVALST